MHHIVPRRKTSSHHKIIAPIVSLQHCQGNLPGHLLYSAAALSVEKYLRCMPDGSTIIF